MISFIQCYIYIIYIYIHFLYILYIYIMDIQIQIYRYPISYLKMTKLQKWRTDEQLLGIEAAAGAKGKWVWLLRGSMWNLCRDGNVLYLDYIQVNVQIMILYYCFARYYHRINLVKDTWISTFFFFLNIHLFDREREHGHKKGEWQAEGEEAGS